MDVCEIDTAGPCPTLVSHSALPRLDRELELPIPTAPARKQILTAILDPVPHSLTDTQLTALAGRTHGFVGADLVM